MLEKWKNDPEKRDKLMKAAAVLIILAVIFLSFDVFTQNRDGRKQIIDSDGGTETELCSILSDIDGVGAVDVMLQYGEKDQVAGVIVTAEGAGNVAKTKPYAGSAIRYSWAFVCGSASHAARRNPGAEAEHGQPGGVRV